MEFFVSVELTPQIQWQIELMIESFNALNMQDKLLICFCSDSADDFIPDMVKNLGNHVNTMLIRNLGKTRGHTDLNKLYGIKTALEQKRLGKKFFVLEPDMVICSPPKIETNEISCHFQVDPTFVPEFINEHTDLEKYFNIQPNAIESNQWSAAGSPICFVDFPVEFFDQMILDAEDYVYKQFYYNEKVWNRSMQVIMNMTLYRYIGKYYNAYASFDYKSSLHSKTVNNFIHYEHGYQPLFHKNMFPYKPPHFLSLGNPFKTLAEYSPTPAFQFISNLSKQYLKR